ncbi:MAG: hypothetical protein J6575_03600 [Bifidobacterium sp.]|nr:hypothetical protein [Bifidobacterium sp.]
MTGECFECGAQTQPGFIQCDGCAGKLRREIHDIGVMYRFLVVMLDPSVRFGERGGGTHAASSTPNINANIYDLINDKDRGIRAILGGYARDLGLEWRGSVPELVKELETCTVLQSTMYTDWRRPEIHALVQRVRKATTPPPPPERLLGWCLNPLCRRALNIERLPYSVTSVRCEGCGCEWTVEAIRQHNMERLNEIGDDEEWQLGAKDCSTRIRQLTGLNISSTTIRSWAKRGQLQPVYGTSPARYRLGDVWQLIDQDHRKETGRQA